MSNFQVYKKTFLFSLVYFGVGLVSLAIVVGFATGGFFIFNSATDRALIGMFVGLLIGIAIAVAIDYLVLNRIKAAQIGMIAIGVADDKLPEHTFKEGFKLVKGRFAKLTLFFMIMRAIKGIFNQIGRGVNSAATAVAGQAGDVVSSTINSAVQTVISYLCDCCLGWVMYNKDTNMAKAACEGAVIFFKHGKTLIRNIGRIFGMGIASFILIGGSIFGILFAIFYNLPGMFIALANEITEFFIRIEADVPEFLTNPMLFAAIAAAIIAIVLWSMIHSVTGHPFILVGVLRNFMASGLKDRPTEQDFATLDSKSPKFAKLHKSI